MYSITAHCYEGNDLGKGRAEDLPALRISCMEKSRDFMGGSRGEEGSFLLSLLTNCMPGSPWTRQGDYVQRIRDNLSNVFLEDFKLLV